MIERREDRAGGRNSDRESEKRYRETETGKDRQRNGG